MAANVVVNKALGLNTQPNELTCEPGSLAVAENVEITRDGVIEVSRGFEDYSANMPDFTPAQLLSIGGVAYLHLDDGLWYYDTASSSWLRKRGNFGSAISSANGVVYGAGHLYVSTASHVVLDINLSTGARTILAGRFGVSAHTDGTGGAARFNLPDGIASDGTNLYVCDAGNNCIRKIVIATGVVTTPYGVAAPATTAAHTDGTGNAARFSQPIGIVSDGTNLYVADSNNNCIRKIVISSGVVTTPHGIADPLTTSGFTDGTGNAARFWAPAGIASDGTNLYVAEANNSGVRKIVISSGVVTSPFGVAAPGPGVAAHTDGTGNASRFATPIGIYFDGTDLYVCDQGNNCIRKIVISSGVVTTPCGVAAPASTLGSVDGVGNAARFSSPRHVTSDGSNLYVGDTTNLLLRKIYVSTAYVATVDGVPAVTAPSAGLPLAGGIIQGPS